MAQTFWGGFTEGIGAGISYAGQIQEAKERKRLQEEARKTAEELKMAVKKSSEKIQELYSDKVWSYDDYVSMIAYSSSLPIELQDRLLSINDKIWNGQFDEAKNEIEAIQSLTENALKIKWDNPNAVENFKTFLNSNVVSSRTKQWLSIADEYTQKILSGTAGTRQWERTKETAELIPPDARSEYLTKQGYPVPKPKSETEKRIEEVNNAYSAGYLNEEERKQAIKQALNATQEDTPAIREYNFLRSINVPEDKALEVAFGLGQKTSAGEEPAKIREVEMLANIMDTSPEEAAKIVYNIKEPSTDKEKTLKTVQEIYDFVTKDIISFPPTEEERQTAWGKWQAIKQNVDSEMVSTIENLLKANNLVPVETTAETSATTSEQPKGNKLWNWLTGKGNEATPEGVLTGKTPPQTTTTQQQTQEAPQASVSNIPSVNKKPYSEMTEEELKVAVLNGEEGAIEEARRRKYIR